MKIGIFAKLNRLEISAVRFYIDSGLLLPSKNGTQYDFSSKDMDDAKTITALRSMGFGVKDISNWFKITRSYSEHDSLRYDKLIKMLANRKYSLSNELEETQNRISQVKNSITDYSNKIKELNLDTSHPMNHIHEIGIPVRILDMLSCPICGGTFDLKNVNISGTTISNGNLECSCGYTAEIVDGFLYTNKNKDLDNDKHFVYEYFGDDKELIKKNEIMLQYLPVTQPEYLSFRHKARLWLDKQMAEMDNVNKTILIPDVSSHFLYHYFDKEYFNNSIIIVVGLSKDSITGIYEHLLQFNSKLNIAFIVSPNGKLPLRKKCIDFVLDDNGTFNLSFFLNDYYYKTINHLLSDNCTILGSTDYYSKNSKTLSKIKGLYSSCTANGQSWDYMKKSLIDLGFHFVIEENIGGTTHPGMFFEYHCDGDYRGNYNYLATKDIHN